eukprot:6198257-Pleurochrysis_carterae.AAC.3
MRDPNGNNSKSGATTDATENTRARERLARPTVHRRFECVVLAVAEAQVAGRAGSARPRRC